MNVSFLQIFYVVFTKNPLLVRLPTLGWKGYCTREIYYKYKINGEYMLALQQEDKDRVKHASGM